MTTPHRVSGQVPRHREAADIRVEQAMHCGVLVCSRETLLSTVAQLMAQHRIHSVIVADNAGSLWGVISDLDLVAAASVRDLEEQSAGATAASEALTVASRETLLRAAQIMTEHASAHLMVVDRKSGRPVGVRRSISRARSQPSVRPAERMDADASTVGLAPLVTALATGLGATPFLVFRSLGLRWLALANAAAAGFTGARLGRDWGKTGAVPGRCLFPAMSIETGAARARTRGPREAAQRAAASRGSRLRPGSVRRRLKR